MICVIHKKISGIRNSLIRSCSIFTLKPEIDDSDEAYSRRSWLFKVKSFVVEGETFVAAGKAFKPTISFPFIFKPSKELSLMLAHLIAIKQTNK